MREALIDFLQEVRRAGVPLSIAESMDALRAASVVVPEREILREALASAVVKDESDREAFDEVFERFFGPGSETPRRKRRRKTAAGEGGSPGASEGEGAARIGRPSERSPARRPAPREDKRTEERAELHEGEREPARRRRHSRELLRKPFREMDVLEAEEISALAATLARRFRGRLRRRRRIGRRGRLDFRRTLRRSVSRGGAAVDLVFRPRRPGKPDLVALCDVSGSVRYASEFFTAVLVPCGEFFRRVRIFAFVDHLVEATVENGRLVPHEPVDFHAFSDLGRVLVELEEAAVPLGRSTVLVVLGDARNNRRPPRADRLAKIRFRARALWWLNPERRELWGRGDSVIESYRPYCDQLLECADGAALLRALYRIAR